MPLCRRRRQRRLLTQFPYTPTRRVPVNAGPSGTDAASALQGLIGDASTRIATLFSLIAADSEHELPPHISLSRSFSVRHHQIGALSQRLQTAASTTPAFEVGIGDPCFLVNEARSRSFLALRVIMGLDSVHSLLSAVDAALAEFGKPKYYVPPLPHVSIATVDGDASSPLAAAPGRSESPADATGLPVHFAAAANYGNTAISGAAAVDLHLMRPKVAGATGGAAAAASAFGSNASAASNVNASDGQAAATHDSSSSCSLSSAGITTSKRKRGGDDAGDDSSRGATKQRATLQGLGSSEPESASARGGTGPILGTEIPSAAKSLEFPMLTWRVSEVCVKIGNKLVRLPLATR